MVFDTPDFRLFWQQVLKVAAPPRRVVAAPKPTCRCPIQYRLNATADRLAVSGLLVQIGSITFMISPTSTDCTDRSPITG